MEIKNDQKIYIVVPAFNEERVILSVINSIKEYGYENIIVVDDGSPDDTYGKARLSNNAVALRHAINRGKGAATKTGIEAAKLLGADIIVTMDGDGQHDPSDISHLIAPILKHNYDVALGTRLKNTRGMPFYKIILNHLGNIITWYLFGLYVTDSQSGFRAYSRYAMEVIDTKGDRYEYDSEIIREIYLSKLKYKEVPISVIYTEYSKQKIHKQGFYNGLKTLYKMVLKLIN
jgi:UDP-N-acetylglucosamine---dolichyl-phosphate N-acetylglucosaminyltransferase